MSISIKPIKTKSDYEAVLAEIDRLFDVAPNMPEEDYLEVLSILVEVYESEHYPVPPPDPIDAILHVMDAYQMVEKDLEPYIGNQTQISRVLSRKQPLTLPMIRKLHKGLAIPAEIFIQPTRKLVAA